MRDRRAVVIRVAAFTDGRPGPFGGPGRIFGKFFGPMPAVVSGFATTTWVYCPPPREMGQFSSIFDRIA